MRISMTILACLTLAACAPKTYDKQGLTHAQKQKDLQDCQYEAQVHTSASDGVFHQANLIDACLRNRGYSTN